MPETLYDISEDVRLLVEAIAATEDDDECKALAEDFLAKREGDLNEKLEAYCYVIGERVAMGKFRKEEGARLTDLAKSDEGTAKRMKDTLKHVLDHILNRPKIETPRYKLNVQGAGGARALELRDGLIAANAPSAYVVHVPTINTEKLKVDLEAREAEIAGIAQFAIPEGQPGHEESKRNYDDAVIAIDTKYKEALTCGSLKPRGRILVIK